MKEKVLILGGTEFVGKLLVETLISDQSKELYLFNRGKTNPHLFPNINKIIGDRETDDIQKIQAHKWDYIIDFSSYYPASLQRTLDHVNRDLKKYIYISTISVYDFSKYDRASSIKEDFPIVDCSPEEAIDQTMKTYGKKKAACEAVLKESSWLNSVILRPSIIFGIDDPTDRFYYWLRKIKKETKAIVPNDGTDQISLTYANDLVAIILKGISGDIQNGAYNCITHDSISFNELLETIKKSTDSNCEFYHKDNEELRAQEVFLPLNFISNLYYNNDKIKEATNLSFTTYENAITAMVDHFEKEEWKKCMIEIDDEKLIS